MNSLETSLGCHQWADEIQAICTEIYLRKLSNGKSTKHRFSSYDINRLADEALLNLGCLSDLLKEIKEQNETANS